MDINYEALGFTQEELQQRVVDQVTERLLSQYVPAEYDDDPGGYTGSSELHKKLYSEIQSRIDSEVTRIGDEHVLPVVRDRIETLVLKETNEWGENKGKEYTFIEYLISRAKDYMLEEVDHQGKSRKNNSYGSWTKSGTRIAHTIDKYLQSSVEKAMKEVLENANETLVEGLVKTCEMKLVEISKSLKVSVAT